MRDNDGRPEGSFISMPIRLTIFECFLSRWWLRMRSSRRNWLKYLSKASSSSNPNGCDNILLRLTATSLPSAVCPISTMANPPVPADRSSRRASPFKLWWCSKSVEARVAKKFKDVEGRRGEAVPKMEAEGPQ